MPRHVKRHASQALLLLAIFLPAPALVADPGPGPGPEAPAGFAQFGVFLGSGLYNAATPHPDPEIVGCFFGACDGLYFQEKIMGRTPGEILDEELDAKDFFRQRFGIDLNDPETASRVLFRSVLADPRLEYRLYHLAGMKIPPQGYPVRDGAFQVLVIDPDGLELGGDFAGTHISFGAFVVYGEYNILVSRPNGQPADEIVIRFKSASPAVSQGDLTHFECELEHAEWGTGVGHALVKVLPREDGLTFFRSRNVLTFPSDPF